MVYGDYSSSHIEPAAKCSFSKRLFDTWQLSPLQPSALRRRIPHRGVSVSSQSPSLLLIRHSSGVALEKHSLQEPSHLPSDV